MTKITVLSAFTAVFSLMIVSKIHADAVYTTGLNLKKTGNNILLEWKANTNQGTFSIYRSQSFPIGDPISLSNAFKLTTVRLAGTPLKEMYLFSSVTDTLTQDGKYYYLVLPDIKKVSAEDFNPNLNYNISPILYQHEETAAAIDEEGPLVIEENEPAEKEESPPYSGDKITVKSLTIKTNLGVFQLFWDANGIENGNYLFSVYRTTNQIRSSHDLQKLKPIRELKNECFFEDADVKYGVAYYYTIIVNDYKIILSGENQNLLPVFWGNTNAVDIKVERDVYRKVKVNTKSFNSRFKK